MPVLRIGLVADTHGVFDPALESPLAGVSSILHAGDVGNHGGAGGVLAHFTSIAPTTAVRGNVDDDAEAAELLPENVLLTLNGWRVLLLHILDSAAGRAAVAVHRPVDVVIHGHSHSYSVVHSVIHHGNAPTAAGSPAAPAAAAASAAAGTGWRLAVNPGSAGPARFSLGRSAAVLTLPPKGAAGRDVEPCSCGLWEDRAQRLGGGS